MRAYNAWMIEKDALKASGTSPNLEKFTFFYEKMSNQQLDAIYIRKQFEELNKSNEPSGSSGGKEQVGGSMDTPGKNVGKIKSIF